MKNKYALYPIIMSFCSLICFIVVLLFFATAVQPLWGKIMLLILPALILGVVAFCAVKGKLGVVATIVWTTTLSIVFLFISLFYIVFLSMETATTITTDIRYYSRAYAQIDELKEVREVFPKSIPTDAKNIEFSYMPQFLQGGEVFELSYTTTDDKLSEWSTLLEGNSEWVGSNQQWHNENDWSSDCVDATRYQLYWDGGFNHGEICYALISEELNQITFYYSIW